MQAVEGVGILAQGVGERCVGGVFGWEDARESRGDDDVDQRVGVFETETRQGDVEGVAGEDAAFFRHRRSGEEGVAVVEEARVGADDGIALAADVPGDAEARGDVVVIVAEEARAIPAQAEVEGEDQKRLGNDCDEDEKRS